MSSSRLVQQAIDAEKESLEKMINSMEGIFSNIQKNKSNTNMIQGNCPGATEMLASVASGHVSDKDVELNAIVSVASDLGHDVEFGLENKTSDTIVGDRTVHQEMKFAKPENVDLVLRAASAALDYMNAKLKMLS